MDSRDKTVQQLVREHLTPEQQEMESFIDGVLEVGKALSGGLPTVGSGMIRGLITLSAIHPKLTLWELLAKLRQNANFRMTLLDELRDAGWLD